MPAPLRSMSGGRRVKVAVASRGSPTRLRPCPAHPPCSSLWRLVGGHVHRLADGQLQDLDVAGPGERPHQDPHEQEDEEHQRQDQPGREPRLHDRRRGGRDAGHHGLDRLQPLAGLDAEHELLQEQAVVGEEVGHALRERRRPAAVGGLGHVEDQPRRALRVRGRPRRARRPRGSRTAARPSRAGARACGRRRGREGRRREGRTCPPIPAGEGSRMASVTSTMRNPVPSG